LGGETSKHLFLSPVTPRTPPGSMDKAIVKYERSAFPPTLLREQLPEL
jgi:hypothetical protein